MSGADADTSWARPVAQRKSIDNARDPVGLKNLGNTGWMNSGLQCLFAVKELTFYFLEDRYKADLNATNFLGYGGDVAQAYATLLDTLHREITGKTFVPRAFMGIVNKYGAQFDAGRSQADAQEFISWLLDAMDQDLSRIVQRTYAERPVLEDEMAGDASALREFAERCESHDKTRNDSIVQDFFRGVYKTTLSCLVCGKVAVMLDPFFVLALTPKQTTTAQQGSGGGMEQKRTATLEECLANTYNKREVLSIEDAWFCPKCSDYRKGSVLRELWSLPDTLIVHIKRFPKPGVVYLPTDYPVEGLDLSVWVSGKEDKNLMYDLVAVVNHRVAAGGRGYYSAFVKSFDDGKWREYDDSSVTDCDARSVVMDGAYVLFYQRRTRARDE